MKKLAIGCGIVVLVVGIAAVGAMYYAYTKVKSTVTQLAELGQVSDIEKSVTNTSPFTPPSNRELTATQIERLVQVQTRVREKLGAGAAELDRNYKTFLDKKDHSIADLPALLAAYKDLAKTLVDAKRTQIEVLNQLDMSLGEYRWIRAEAYHSLGIPFVDMDLGRLAERAKSGQTAGAIAFNGAPGDKPLDTNVKLVEKHRKQLEDYMALASFGL